VVRTQVAENKNRAADVPAELRHALHRRLPARRNGELGARVTSGRDSRETQSVNGELRVVNPPRMGSAPGSFPTFRACAFFSTSPDRCPSLGNRRP
jgi:hypothetical protein